MTIFQSGGALSSDHATYITRDADHAIMNALDAKCYSHVIAPRQIGKTSLVRHIRQIVQNQGWHYCYVDLSTLKKFGQVEWYRKLGTILSKSLPPSGDLHDQIDFKEYLLGTVLDPLGPSGNVVLVLDEIEGMVNLEFSDEFFSTLRSIYNERDSYNGNFALVLAGNIDPSQLIKDPAISPFNVSQEIILQDFSLEQTRQLTEKLNLLGIPVSDESHKRVYEWTSGQPYLTQKLCSILEISVIAHKIFSITPVEIDDIVERIMLNPLSLEPNLQHIEKEISRLSANAQKTWQKIIIGSTVSRIQRGVDELSLLGAIKMDGNDQIIIRNKIYELGLRGKRELDIDQKLERRREPRINVELLTEVIPTAYCFHLTADHFPLIQVVVDNSEGESNLVLHVETYIDGYSDKDVKPISLEKGKTEVLKLLPVLKPEEIATLNEITQATLFVAIEENNPTQRLLFKRSFPVHLHAKNTALLSVTSNTNKIIDLTDRLAAWITPHNPEIEKLLNGAIKHHSKHSFVGYQSIGGEDIISTVREQAKAIFDTLKIDIKLAYIDSPLNFGTQEGEWMQRVRLPSDCLNSGGSANCLDGTVLFASLLELVGIDPIIVLIPGHAFVGWHVLPSQSEYEFLETTMIGSEEFDNAQKAAKSKYEEAIINLSKGQGFLRIIDIKECRDKKIYPIG